MLAVELSESSWKSSSFFVDNKYQKGLSRENYIILLLNSKYKRRWIKEIYLQNKHDINVLY